jgi:hypothetical protein
MHALMRYGRASGRQQKVRRPPVLEGHGFGRQLVPDCRRVTAGLPVQTSFGAPAAMRLRGFYAGAQGVPQGTAI